MKETIKRAVRTFWQAFAGYVSVNIVVAVSAVGGDTNALKTGLTGLVVAAVAAGLAALMNLPVKTTKNTEESK